MRELTVSITETITYSVTIEVEDALGLHISETLARVDAALTGCDAWAGATVEDRSRSSRKLVVTLPLYPLDKVTIYSYYITVVRRY